MNATAIRRRGRRHGLLTALLSLLSIAAAAGEIGREVGLESHLENGEEYILATDALREHGRHVFEAVWTVQEGGGRPLSKGTGAPLADLSSPLIFPRNRNRISAPDADACSACHHRPRVGGAGDLVANLFLLGQRFDFATFDSLDAVPTRGGRDESGAAVTLGSVANERNPPGLFGVGFVEMLARQMTADLRVARDGLTPGASIVLESKGVAFGSLSRAPNGAWDTAAVEGLPPPSLASAGPDDPPSLVIRPFHQAGAVVSIREFTNNALNHHHGIQAAERFGDGDPDGDGFTREVTRADVTAVVIFQATLPVPGRVISRERASASAVWRGERLFAELGCADCHRPSLPLDRGGWVFSEPNPHNPPGNLRPGEAAELMVDLTDPRLGLPRLSVRGGVVAVPAYTDLKLHDITTGPDDPNCEPLDMHQAPGSPDFFAGNCRFLTRRLWGVASEPPFFHHGKFTTLREAVDAHRGEAEPAYQAWRSRSEDDRGAIIEFLKSLRILPPGSRSRFVDERGRPRAWPPVGG